METEQDVLREKSWWKTKGFLGLNYMVWTIICSVLFLGIMVAIALPIFLSIPKCAGKYTWSSVSVDSDGNKTSIEYVYDLKTNRNFEFVTTITKENASEEKDIQVDTVKGKYKAYDTYAILTYTSSQLVETTIDGEEVVGDVVEINKVQYFTCGSGYILSADQTAIFVKESLKTNDKKYLSGDYISSKMFLSEIDFKGDGELTKVSISEVKKLTINDMKLTIQDYVIATDVITGDTYYKNADNSYRKYDTSPVSNAKIENLSITESEGDYFVSLAEKDTKLFFSEKFITLLDNKGVFFKTSAKDEVVDSVVAHSDLVIRNQIRYNDLKTYVLKADLTIASVATSKKAFACSNTNQYGETYVVSIQNKRAHIQKFTNDIYCVESIATAIMGEKNQVTGSGCYVYQFDVTSTDNYAIDTNADGALNFAIADANLNIIQTGLTSTSEYNFPKVGKYFIILKINGENVSPVRNDSYEYQFTFKKSA